MINRLHLDEEELEALREITALVPRRRVVLLVDDDRAGLARLRRLVEGAGLRCVTASSAAEALRRILRDEAVIDLLVTGLRMEQEGAGLELIRQLSTVGTFLPIIILSGQIDLRDVFASTSLNVLDFLPKPVDSASFLRSLGRCL